MIKKLSLRPTSGLLTPLQSDTVFGHFCWRMIEIKGEEILKRFLGKYHDRNPVFTLSDGLFEVEGEVLFPKPLRLPILRDQSLEKAEMINEFLLRKEILERKFITAGHLQLFLDGKMEEYETRYVIEQEPKSALIHDELRSHVRINRETLKGEDATLFQMNPEYLGEGTDFAILIKVLDENGYQAFDVEAIFREVFETGYGKRKSSGYGGFSVLGFSEYNLIKEPEIGRGFVTIGNYLPSNSDNPQPGFYDYMVKYGKLGEGPGSGNNPFKKPIIMMKPGSCFQTDTSKPFYGRMTTTGEISSQTEVYQCGIPFTLNYK